MLQFLLDQQGMMPAFIMGRRWDILAWNRAGAVLLGDFDQMPPEERNVLWLTFGVASIRDILVDWEEHARRLLAEFRTDYDLYPGDHVLQARVEQLHEICPEFREWWQDYEVKDRVSVYKLFNHPQGGLLTFEQTTLLVHDNPQLRLVVEVPVPETPTLERLQRLMLTQSQSQPQAIMVE
jgi:hypothetical protein